MARNTRSVLPETRYAKSGDVHVAYQVVGSGGPSDLVFVTNAAHHLELNWENPPMARFLDRLATLCRLIVFDKRGTGMSDRVVGVPTLETRMDDIRAVMDDAGSDRAVIFGLGDGGPLCTLFAATFPERTAGLILMNSSPRFVKAPDLPWLPSRGELEQLYEEHVRRQIDPARRSERPGSFLIVNPDATEDEVVSFTRVFRLSLSPSALAGYLRMNLDLDVRDILSSIRVPTVVLHRRNVPRYDLRSGRYLADRIPGARLVELEGRNLAPSLGDQEALFAEIDRFLAEVQESRGWASDEPERVLSTVLFTDIVDATARAAELGDRGWRELLEQHHNSIRRQLARFRGKEVDTAGDGFFASFDGPARAIRCACAVVSAVRELGLEVRAGLHTGECELVDGKVGGIAVHIGARVAAQATPGEVLVSSTVRDLVAGSGIQFVHRGETTLKGVPGNWHLFAALPEETAIP
jgi:class 3 adenylate cyclase